MSPLRRALIPLLAGLAGCTNGEIPDGVPWVTAPGYEDHGPYFPIDSGKHEGIDCNKCHGDFDTFTEFTCISCHVHSAEETNPPHDGLPGYTYTSTSCFTCHPRGEVDGAGPGHERLFPVAEGTAHADTRCSGCHIDPDDREVVTCVDCHAHEVADSAAKHGPVGGYLYETAECLRCHYDSAVPRVADHVPFRIDAEASHDPGSAECLRCHTAVQAERPFPSADFARFECTGCHLRADLEPSHGTMPDYRFESPVCLTCHVDGETISRVEHDRIFPVSAGTKHETTDCGSCHADASDVEVVTCVGCHPHERAASSTAHRGVGGYTFQSDLCLRCHPSSGVDRLAQHRPFRIDNEAKHKPEKAECLECHSSLDASYPFPAADFAVFGCTTMCHGNRGDLDDEHRGERGYAYDDPLSCVQSGCHPDGQKE